MTLKIDYVTIYLVKITLNPAISNCKCLKLMDNRLLSFYPYFAIKYIRIDEFVKIYESESQASYRNDTNVKYNTRRIMPA
jgi:hypothetical protein